MGSEGIGIEYTSVNEIKSSAKNLGEYAEKHGIPLDHNSSDYYSEDYYGEDAPIIADETF